MARGDGSGGLGWLITFACLALVGLVGTGVLFVAESSARKEVAAAQKQVSDLTTQKNQLANKLGVYEAIVSGTNTASNADIVKQLEALPGVTSMTGTDKAAVDKAIADFKAKIDFFGPNFQEARNLNSLVSYLVEELNRKNASIVDEQKKTNDMQAAVAKAIEENKKISEEAVKGQRQAEADLAKARADFEQQLATNATTNQEITGRLTAALNEAAKINEVKKELAAKEKDLNATTEQLNEKLKKERIGDQDLAKLPVADVIFANQLADTITINRGLQDGIRRQMTMSVYGKDETNLARATPKASVEVVQVTGPNTSECRIISGKLRDPIIKGDVLYTPAWKPGQKVHFVLGPNMDVNGDNDVSAEELELLRGLIALNGGVVDSYVDIDGTIKNEKGSEGMSFATRFYVVGLLPRRDQKEVAKKLEDDAKKFGVEVINITKMLDYMGYSVKRATRSIVSSPTPVLERRPPGEEGAPATESVPATTPTETPKAEPTTEDPFAEPSKPAAEPKKEAPAVDDPFADPPK